jgi:CHASE3 domain sensor protein
VQLAFGSAILTLLVVGVVSYRLILVSSESDQWVRHTHEVLQNLQDLFGTIGNIESSSRGFALTGEESFLESYRDGIARAQQDEETIRNLTADNLAQQRRIPVLAALVTWKIQFSSTVIGLRQSDGLEAAANAVKESQDQRGVNEIAVAIQEMREEELRLLISRGINAKRRLDQTRIVLILGTILG